MRVMHLHRGPAGTITSKILREERILLKESTCFSVDVERHALFFQVWAKLLSKNLCLRTGDRLSLNLLRHKGCVMHDRQIESNSTADSHGKPESLVLEAPFTMNDMLDVGRWQVWHLASHTAG
jgi:hypothetical protein